MYSLHRRFVKAGALLGLTVALPLSAVAPPGSPPVPLLWYRFDSIKGTRVPDAAGPGHDGTFESRSKSIVAHVVATPYGPALKLAKGDGIRTRMTPDLACPDGLTVMAWARPDAVNRHLAVVAAMSDRVPNEKAAGYRLSLAWGAAFGELGFGDPAGARISTPGFSVAPKHWVHVALTFDGTDMILYLNAVEAARKHFPGKRRIRRFPGRYFTVGKYYWHDAYPFEGLLADVRIYDRALSPGQLFQVACQWLGTP